MTESPQSPRGPVGVGGEPMVLIVQLILITPRELLVISSTVLRGKIQEVLIVTVASIKTSFYSRHHEVLKTWG